MSDLATTMREVEKTADQWAHVHRWFHERRINRNCPHCNRNQP